MIKRKYHKKRDKETTDEALAGFVLDGKTRYFEEIVIRYEKKLLLYLRYLIGGSDEVSDLLQNVFTKAFEHLGDFDAKRKFSPWIYRIAHNEAVNYLKKQSYRRLVDWETFVSSKDRANLADERETPFETQMRDDARITVRKALNILPEKDREILKLRYYLNKSYAEMSEILHKPENTIASHLSRAKKKLLVILDEQGTK